MTEPDPRALAAQLVIPLLDLRPGAARPPAEEWSRAEALRDQGVGGFILFGGEREDLRARLADLRAGAPRGLLVGADLERGLAQQVVGGRPQPPAMALGAADDPALAERAGAALGAEALATGIDWVLGPVLDLADEPRNPIVGTRAFAARPEAVARLGAAFVRGLQSAGVLACAKHFPGHGATTADSHDDLPVVSRDADLLRARDLLPFRAAVDAGVATVMTAHVSYPTLSPGDPRPATLNPALVDGLLRGELGFRGAVVTDALIMAGVQQGTSEAQAAPLAVAAGCDLLLYPQDPAAVIEALAAWATAAPEHLVRLQAAARRVLDAKARVGRPSARPPGDEQVGDEVAARALTRAGPLRASLTADRPVALVVIDDDGVLELGHELLGELDAAGIPLHPVVLRAPLTEDARARLRQALQDCPRVVVAVGCRVRAWKGRPGLAPELAELLASLPGERTTVVALCGPYPLRGVVPEAAELLLAYGDEGCCQRAAARALLGGPAPGRSPVPDPPPMSG